MFCAEKEGCMGRLMLLGLNGLANLYTVSLLWMIFGFVRATDLIMGYLLEGDLGATFVRGPLRGGS